jgi:hypothetical protein
MSDATLLPGAHRLRSRDRGAAVRPGHLQAVATRGARGAIVIALAVIVGVVLLQVVDKGNTGPVGDQSAKVAATTTTTAKSGTSTSVTTATTAPQAARPPSQIVVQVLNGSGKSGVAGALTQQFKSKGYQTVDAKDTIKRTGTVVYYRPGFDREAAAIATLIAGSQIAPMPTPPPSGASPNANIVVVIGG